MSDLGGVCLVPGGCLIWGVSDPGGVCLVPGGWSAWSGGVVSDRGGLPGPGGCGGV